MLSLIIVAIFVAALFITGVAMFIRSRSNIAEKALALAAMNNFTEARALVRNLLDTDPENTHYLY